MGVRFAPAPATQVIMLEPELRAVEAVFPVVQQKYRAKLERIEQLSKLDLSTKSFPPVWK